MSRENLTYTQALHLAFTPARYRLGLENRSQEVYGWQNLGHITNPATGRREWYPPVTPRRLEWD